MKPLLRWAGSKRKLLPELRDYWDNNFNKYLEPFVGSACLFFELLPKKAVLSDKNKDLINTYKILANEPIRLHQLVSSYPNDEKKYYELRDLKKGNLNKLERAARFIYLNRYCFNGLYRTNKKGEFNVPYAGSRTGKIQTKEKFKEYSEVLRKIKITDGDFEEIILDNVKTNDFVYLDPPYSKNNKRIFNQYGPDNFGINDMKRLVDLLEILQEKNVNFLVSYADTEQAIEFFDNWKISHVNVQRNIAGFSKHRRKAGEILVSNIDTCV